MVKKKIGSAWLIIYTAHFIRAGPIFLVRVPILSVLGPPFQTVQAWVKFGSVQKKFGTGKVIYTAKFIRAEPIFWVRVPFLSEPSQKFLVV